MDVQTTTANPAASADRYWATLEPEKLIGEAQGHERNWWQAGVERGYWSLLRLIYAQAQGIDPRNGGRNTTQRLTFSGPTASTVRFRINLVRGYIKQRNVMAQGERPSFQCLALNDDFSSLAQVPMAQSALDYLYRSARGEKIEWAALESDGYFGEGFVWGRWDFSAGNDVSVESMVPAMDEVTGEALVNPVNGQPLMKPVKRLRKSGAPTLTSLYPWEVVREPYAKESIWCIVREVCSKHEIAARFPEKAAKIRAVDNLRGDIGAAEMFGFDISGATNDQIIVRHFYHQACDAVPGGRYVGYAGDVVLWDVACPLPEGMPVISVCSAKYFATTFGYPESTDLLAPQEMIDEILTQWANNTLRFGRQSLFAEEGVEIDLEKLSRGGAFFRTKPGQKPPQVIDWAKMPESTKWGLEFLLARLNEISGMNATVRGDPGANITSGAFAALMVNVAQKFVSATEATLDFGRNATANMILQLVRANADTAFLVEVAGANQAPYLREFTAADFSGIKRVVANTANPLLRSIPGRMEMWNAIKDVQNPKDRQAVIQLMTTGNFDGFTDSDQSTYLLIQYENEKLMKGEWCEPAKSDHPALHNERHKAAYDKLRTQPNADPNALLMLQEHMAKHALLWAGTDPTFALTVNIPRPPPQLGPDGLPLPGSVPHAPQAAANAGHEPSSGSRVPEHGQPDQPRLPKQASAPPTAVSRPDTQMSAST